MSRESRKGRKKIVIPSSDLKVAQEALLGGASWQARAMLLGVAVGTLRARLVEAGLGVEVRKMAVGAGERS